uniref:Uncharacterized protein n=1 Tax=Trichogramma kaykai TaxID=54128 RepID=A0ABD2W3I7_9HYME
MNLEHTYNMCKMPMFLHALGHRMLYCSYHSRNVLSVMPVAWPSKNHSRAWKKTRRAERGNYISRAVLMPMLLESSDIELSKPLLSDLLKNLEDRFTDYFNVRRLGVNTPKAAFLHPQFKLKWLDALNSEAKKKFFSLCKSHVIGTDGRRDT